MKYVKFLCCLVLMSCSTSKVIVDYDTEVDFSNFTTYALYDDVGEGFNELDVKRITTILNNKLKTLKFQQVENPTMFINFKAKVAKATNNNTIGIGIGSGGRNGGFGVSGGIPIGGKKLNEIITIEFVNATTNQLIWEGSITSTIKEKRSPEEKEGHFESVIQEILAEYPAQKKSSKN